MKVKVNNKILKTSQTVDCSTICKNIALCEHGCVGLKSKSQYIDVEVLGNNGEPVVELNDNFVHAEEDKFENQLLVKEDDEYKRKGEEKW